MVLQIRVVFQEHHFMFKEIQCRINKYKIIYKVRSSNNLISKTF